MCRTHNNTTAVLNPVKVSTARPPDGIAEPSLQMQDYNLDTRRTRGSLWPSRNLQTF